MLAVQEPINPLGLSDSAGEGRWALELDMNSGVLFESAEEASYQVCFGERT